MKSLITLLLVVLSLLSVAQTTITSGMTGIQLRNALNNNFIRDDQSIDSLRLGLSNIDLDTITSNQIKTGYDWSNWKNGVYRYNADTLLNRGSQLYDGLSVTVTQGSATITLNTYAASYYDTYTNNFLCHIQLKSGANRIGRIYKIISHLPGTKDFTIDVPMENTSGTYTCIVGQLQTTVDFIAVSRYSDSSENYGKREIKYVVNQQLPYRNLKLGNKQGIVLFRHDNFNNTVATALNTNVYAMANWLTIFDKWNLKVLMAMNEQWPEILSDKQLEFWRSVQRRGHEVADHGPNHTNYSYIIKKTDCQVSPATLGVMRIENYSSTHYKVVMDTNYYSSKSYITQAGFDNMLKHSQWLFEQYGLNPFTYFVEGGGQGVYYPNDSVYLGAKNNKCIGGGMYGSGGMKYRHMGYNPPLDFVGKSEYFMDWEAPESIGVGSGSMDIPAGGARSAIKKIVDQSARHSLTILRQHVEGYEPPYLWLSYLDSICEAIASNPVYIANCTGSETAKIMYQTSQNQYINYMPCNPLTGQCFEDNIDAKYGDVSPDGFDLTPGATWITTGGSQSSKGYVRVSPVDSLFMDRLYGVEKGTNAFTIDVKNTTAGSNANVKVVLKWYYWNGSSFSNSSTTLTLPSTNSWVTQTADVTFPYNTAYLTMYVYSDTGNCDIDEITLKKKY